MSSLKISSLVMDNPDKTIIHLSRREVGQKLQLLALLVRVRQQLSTYSWSSHDIERGQIMIDGVDIKNMQRSEVHDAFMVPRYMAFEGLMDL